MFNFDIFKKSEYKNHFKKYFVFLKNQKGGITKVILFTTISIFSLAVLTYFLFVRRLISGEFFFGSIVVYLGWLFAFLTGLFHTKQNREDNLIIQNNEIKKRLEIEAFKEVNEMIEEINLASSEIGAYYGYELIKELSSDEDTLFLDKLQSYTQLNKQMEDRLLMLWIKFQLKIRAYEIVLIRFNDLKNKLNLKFKKSVLLVSEFGNYTQGLKTKNSLSKEEFLEIKNKCEKIDESLSILGKGLTNYSNELQNEMLGEIFNSKIPKLKSKETRRTFAQIISSIYKQDK